ncbi:SlyX family protein [Crenothrix polyspora]|jgi:SlyX protein|uniref:Protein SlyX homolog n=1 Tax=Crenothrix polyspora TaxID=360316 RepID=A0A1R4H4B2_9GAMM|nr:SlyX family protein [Crenothrix polyspora]SJM91074.1 Protein SlyX homolog [Crenothrix polyspora]
MDTGRLIELEIKAAYQEDLLQSLNKTVGDQQQQIDRLGATCRVLSERLKSLASQNNADESLDQTPPHY